MWGICKTAVLLTLLGFGAHSVWAQDIAESAAMNSHSAITASSVKLPPVTMATTTPAPTQPAQNTSPHLMARTGPPPDSVNRQDFENNAGEKAGKLLLRSVPSGAEVFINDMIVGRTPLLMVIAPGKYKIDMRGARQDSGQTTVGLMPKETQTVVINLNQRYPTTVAIH